MFWGIPKACWKDVWEINLSCLECRVVGKISFFVRINDEFINIFFWSFYLLTGFFFLLEKRVNFQKWSVTIRRSRIFRGLNLYRVEKLALD